MRGEVCAREQTCNGLDWTSLVGMGVEAARFARISKMGCLLSLHPSIHPSIYLFFMYILDCWSRKTLIVQNNTV